MPGSSDLSDADRIVAALNEVADALRANTGATQQQDPRFLEALEMQNVELRRNNDLRDREQRRTEEWERVERAHMEVCEKRYHELMAGDGGGRRPVRH